MHGNHQNWKGNKGVPSTAGGAPLSLHGGCLATPASRSSPLTPRFYLSFYLRPALRSPPRKHRSRCTLPNVNQRSTLLVALRGYTLRSFSPRPLTPSSFSSSPSKLSSAYIRIARYRCSLFPRRRPRRPRFSFPFAIPSKELPGFVVSERVPREPTATPPLFHSSPFVYPPLPFVLSLSLFLFVPLSSQPHLHQQRGGCIRFRGRFASLTFRTFSVLFVSAPHTPPGSSSISSLLFLSFTPWRESLTPSQ